MLSGSTLEAEAGDARGAGVCAVANLMERPDVPQAALAAYLTSAALTLSGCLLDGLVAADRLGGDVRGRQSASVRVVSGASLRVEPVGGWIFASTMRVGLLTSWAVCIESGRLRSSYEPAEGRTACTETWNARWRRSR